MTKTFHINVSLDFVEQEYRHPANPKKPPAFVELGDRPATKWEVMNGIRRLRLKGYNYMPSCERINPDGSCAGHPKEETKT